MVKITTTVIIMRIIIMAAVVINFCFPLIIIDDYDCLSCCAFQSALETTGLFSFASFCFRLFIRSVQNWEKLITNQETDINKLIHTFTHTQMHMCGYVYVYIHTHIYVIYICVCVERYMAVAPSLDETSWNRKPKTKRQKSYARGLM